MVVKKIARVVAFCIFITTLSGCGAPSAPGVSIPPEIFSRVVTPTSEPTSTLEPFPLPTATSPSPFLPTSTNGPVHEIYAGYTGDSEIPFLAVHRSGEKLVTTHSPAYYGHDGVIWTAPSGYWIILSIDSNGLPRTAAVGEYTVLYGNYAKSTVDLTIIAPNGERQNIRVKYNADLLSRTTAYHSSYDSVAFSVPSGQVSRLPQDVLDTLDNALFAIDVATCPLTSANAAVNLPDYVKFFGNVAKACTGAFIGLKIREGKAQNMDVTALEGLDVVNNTIGCTVFDHPKDCVSVIVTAMKTLRVERLGAADEVTPPPPPPPTCQGKYCKP